ncbi:hypothetical protein [Paraglaciecola sp.]|uniref:hypothetical protein n=1 Tax=Paraglaciecola sp. TaxID=1920173 RepID=UPI00273D015E|nr:hypothetical protein [Paraglaciecola sp.]MDP5030506.1 hypothetical protein [Paraglaciecola sp.]
MRELDKNEIVQVGGGVSQEGAIGINMGIISIGVGIAIAGSAPAWFPIAMIGVSIYATASAISSALSP